MQGEVNGGLDAPHLLGAIGKGTSHHIDPHHEQDGRVAGTLREGLEALLSVAFGDAETVDRGNQERHQRDGRMREVSTDEAKTYIGKEKDKEWGEGEHFFFFIGIEGE